MDLQKAKEVSILLLFIFPVIVTIIGISLQRFLFQKSGQNVSFVQRIISCLTSGIFLGTDDEEKSTSIRSSPFRLGTFLILILPNSLHLAAEQWDNGNVGYILIGLGFFLIYLIKICINLYESLSTSRPDKSEEQQLIRRSTSASNETQWTQLITVVFSLGVHYFFSTIVFSSPSERIDFAF